MNNQGFIVLTGGSGFVGGFLANHLRDLGRPFIEITREAVVCSGKVTPHYGDSARIADALGDLETPTLIHLAAHFVSRHTSADIPALVAGNLGFSTLVYDGFFQSGGRRVVATSSAWQFNETGARAPVNLYSALKAASVDILMYYVATQGGSARELVLFDTYGPRDPRPKLIPALVRHWREGQMFHASPGLQPINLTHVSDVSAALLKAAADMQEQPQAGMITRAVKSSDEEPVRALIEMIQSRIAPSLDVTFSTATDIAAPLALNTSIPVLENWSPRVPLVDGLTELFSGSAS